MLSLRRTSLCISLLAALAAPAAAEARSDYCSASGDVCYAAAKRGSAVSLDLALAAKYFRTFRVCVTPPRGRSSCERFGVRRSGSIYGRSVSWNSNFPNRGSGTYRVNWHGPDGRLGPSVSFRR